MDKGSKKQRKKGKKAVGQTQSQKQSVNIFFDGKPSVGKKKKKQRARRTGTQASRSVQPQRVIYQNQPIPLQPNYSTEINDLRNEVRLSRLASQVHTNQPTGFLMPQPRVAEKAPIFKEEEEKEEKRREKVISRFEGEQGTAVQTEQGIPRAVRGTMEDMISKLEREARNRTEVSGTLDDMIGEVERRDKDRAEVAGVMGGMLGEVERRERDRAQVADVMGGMVNKVERDERMRLARLQSSLVDGTIAKRDMEQRRTIEEAMDDMLGEVEERGKPVKRRGRPKMTEEQKAESARKRAQEKEERLKQPVIGVPVTPELEQVAMLKPREFQEGSLLADLEGAQRLPQATQATSRLASRVSGSRRGVSFAEVEGGGGTFSLPPADFPSDEDDEKDYEKYLEAQGRSRSSFAGRQSFTGGRASFNDEIDNLFQDAEGAEPPASGSFI